MTHSEKLTQYPVSDCWQVRSHAFVSGGLTVQNFVWSNGTSHSLEWHRQRRDFDMETVERVKQEWLREMVNPDNFGQIIGLSLSTRKKAKYLANFINRRA